MKDPAGLTDDELMKLAVAGNEGAFLALYRRCQAAIYRFCLQMSGSIPVAEEVTQEVFLALIRGSARWDSERGPLQSWLVGVARNQVLRFVERDRRHLGVEADECPEPVALNDSVLDDLTRSETREAVRQAVLSLPTRYREVVALCDLQEVTYEEAARILGCAVGTVRSRLHRGRALLIEKLKCHVRCLA